MRPSGEVGEVGGARSLPQMCYDVGVTTHQQLEEIRAALAVLSDGKLDRRDIAAVVSLLGAIAGLASAAYLVLQGVGIV